MLWQFWWRWLLATVVGFVTGTFISLWIIATLTQLFQVRDPFTVFGASALGSAVGGLCLSVAQWIVLRGYVPQAHYWIITTTGSMSLSCAIGAVVGSLTDSVYIGYLLGGLLGILTVGLSQAWVLNRARVGVWMLTTVLGIASGVGIGFLAFMLAAGVISHSVGGGLENLGIIVLGGAVAAVITGASLFGAITGRVLIALLK